MKVVLRADATLHRGSGHVMRCLTLAEELSARRHEVHLVTAPSSIPWLDGVVTASGYKVHTCEPDTLDAHALLAMNPDWVVVDSYSIDSETISKLNDSVPVLAIVDGDTRGIRSSLYVEQNLGSEVTQWVVPPGARMLAGSAFALVRDSILGQRRASPWLIGNLPRIVAFMGGTDPTGAILRVSSELARLDQAVSLTVVAPVKLHSALELELARLPGARIIAPTMDLPSILGEADIVVSAAGTSAWDICSLGLPSVLVAVVGNQSASLEEIVVRELALGLDLVRDGIDTLDQLGSLVGRLLGDESLRKSLSSRSVSEFDGLGKSRVVDAMEHCPRR